ncbi:MAG: Rieske 2Fe-2S domain-containing protein [Burkholderiales bacterium]|nr:Rieske 2Fe-2S domain-containing protein [Burkholderiales bacterium]
MADADIEIGDSRALEEGGEGCRFKIDLGGKAHPGFAIRFDGQVHAFLNRCPHLGTELDWQAGQFFDDSGLYLICATHGAIFMPSTGYCVSGPCKGQRLVRLPVLERDRSIFLTEGFHLYVD